MNDEWWCKNDGSCSIWRFCADSQFRRAVVAGPSNPTHNKGPACMQTKQTKNKESKHQSIDFCCQQCQQPKNHGESGASTNTPTKQGTPLDRWTLPSSVSPWVLSVAAGFPKQRQNTSNLCIFPPGLVVVVWRCFFHNFGNLVENRNRSGHDNPWPQHSGTTVEWNLCASAKLNDTLNHKSGHKMLYNYTKYSYFTTLILCTFWFTYMVRTLPIVTLCLLNITFFQYAVI